MTKKQIWKTKFQNATVGGFALQLSLKQCRALRAIQIMDRDYSPFVGLGSVQVASVSSLIRRGLVVHNWELNLDNPKRKGPLDVKWVYKLTDAGHLVCGLLDIAGITIEEASRLAQVENAS